MKSLSETLMAELEYQLTAIHLKTNDPIACAIEGVKASEAALKSLKKQLEQHEFENENTEIDFFRNTLPRFTAKLLYYVELYMLEVNKPVGSDKILQNHYRNRLKKLQRFFSNNREFYAYYRSGNTSLDHCYFVRNKYDSITPLVRNPLRTDHSITSHSLKVAKILANDEIKLYVEFAILKLKQNTKSDGAHTNDHSLAWTASKVGLIELIYGLQAAGAFNKGAATIADIAGVFESAFDINLGQYRRTFLEIRARKSERIKFIDSLGHNLLMRMDDADE